MSEKVQQAFDIIKEMTVLELSDLSKKMQDEFGVSSLTLCWKAPARRRSR
jgi:ribosomal protein L7/L12